MKAIEMLGRSRGRGDYLTHPRAFVEMVSIIFVCAPYKALLSHSRTRIVKSITLEIG